MELAQQLATMKVTQEVFSTWFPATHRIANPRMRLICFSNAGSAESIYTGATVQGGKRVQSSLLSWAEENQVEVLAVQLPGREKRRKEPFLTSCKQAASAVFPILAAELGGEVPYAIVAHSVGTWVAFELLQLLRERKITMPIHCYFSCFPAPDLPVSERPWASNAGMTDPAFMEECKGWDVNQVVFSKQMWELYGGLLRADFSLFDTYSFEHAGAAPFDTRISTFCASGDKRITRGHVEGWRRFSSSAEFSVSEVEGHHLFVYNAEQKAAWFSEICNSVTSTLAKHLNATSLPTHQFTAVDPALFKLWFPNRVNKVDKPRMRVICFACAGGSETIYTAPVIQSGKRSLNSLMQWATTSQVDVLAVQLPGREHRRKESPLRSCKAVANALLQVLGAEITAGEGAPVPYAFVAHSVGTWVAFELLQLLRERKITMPIHCYFSCFPAPDLPVSERPWASNAGMTDPAFMEECKGWDVNQVVFSKQMWELYGGLLRADFSLFDTYSFEHAGAAPFDTRISTFCASGDKRITRGHVEGWRRFSSSAEFSVSEVEGHHLFVYNAEQKAAWFSAICASLRQALVSVEGGGAKHGKVQADLAETGGFTSTPREREGARARVHGAGGGSAPADSWTDLSDTGGFGKDSQTDAAAAKGAGEGDGDGDGDFGGFGKPSVPAPTPASNANPLSPEAKASLGYGF